MKPMEFALVSAHLCLAELELTGQGCPCTAQGLRISYIKARKAVGFLDCLRGFAMQDGQVAWMIVSSTARCFIAKIIFGICEDLSGYNLINVTL